MTGLIITLKYGYSFEPGQHAGVRGFDTVREALTAAAAKNVYPCDCDDCKEA